MGTQPAEPLDDVLLSLTVINALEVAAARRGGRPLGTLDILLGILGIDLTWGWESVQIEASFVTQDDVERFADPQPQAKGHWHNVPLTTTATRALQTAAAIADRYKLEPMPGGGRSPSAYSPTPARRRALRCWPTRRSATSVCSS